MRDAILVGFVRTPIGKSPRGSLRDTRPDDLAALVVAEAVRRAGIEPSEVEDVILGCAQPEFEQGLNIGRIAALRAGMPFTAAGLQVNRFCASGLEAVAIAAQRVTCGSADVIVAGGVESMSMVPFLGDSTRPNPALLQMRPDTYSGMGPAVEALARQYGILREEADAFSVESHRKALAAQADGRFEGEILPVETAVQEEDAEGRPTIRHLTLDHDEGPRAGTTLEGLAGLKTPFDVNGQITAGNASQRSDGAAAMVVMSVERFANLPNDPQRPALRFAGYAVAATAPATFGVGPALAVPKLLKRTGVSINAIDIVEINEAFAAQVLCSQREFELPAGRLNPNGGAIALGHPLGCTGARQTVTLAHELARSGGRYGIVTMCAALGMGAAGLFERVE